MEEKKIKRVLETIGAIEFGVEDLSTCELKPCPFCGNEECKHYKKCDRNYNKAVKEQNKHHNSSVRCLPIAFSKFTECQA